MALLNSTSYSKRMCICVISFLGIISLSWCIILHYISDEEVINSQISQRDFDKISLPQTTTTTTKPTIKPTTSPLSPIQRTDINDDIFSSNSLFGNEWNSSISLNFDYIISSIQNNPKMHFDVSECQLCEKKNDTKSTTKAYSYKVTSEKRALKNLKIIDFIDQIEPYLITCSNKFDDSFNLHLPIGIPSFDRASMGPWIYNFEHFCFTHAPGLQMDNTFITERYKFRMAFHFKHYGDAGSLQDKFIIDLTPKNSVKNLRNLVFIASYFGANAFQLFLGGVACKMSMIYTLIIEHLHIYRNDFLNISIISHLDIRNEREIAKKASIQSWFWTRFLSHFEGEKFKDRVNITLIDIIEHIGWLKVIPFTYYSQMFVMPHLILRNAKRQKYDHYIYPRGIMQPLSFIFDCEETRDIEPYIILYYDRGSDIKQQRSIKNNEDVMKTIHEWIDNELNVIQSKVEYKFEAFQHDDFSIDRDQNLVSRAILNIGPHGGKFANLMFAKKGTFVLEFNDWLMIHNRDNELRSAYYAMSQAKELHYYYYCPKNFDYQKNKTHPLESWHMEVNIMHLKVLLSMIQKRMMQRIGIITDDDK